MAWLIVRVYDDRRGKNTVDVLKQPSKPRTPETGDIAQLTEKCGIEVFHDNDGVATRKEWPWSILAYSSHSRDGLGHIRRTGVVSLPARPKRRETQP